GSPTPRAIGSSWGSRPDLVLVRAVTGLESGRPGTARRRARCKSAWHRKPPRRGKRFARCGWLGQSVSRREKKKRAGNIGRSGGLEMPSSGIVRSGGASALRNHGEKVKDMAESVLPSTARGSVREQRRRVHRRHRARERDLLVNSRRSAHGGVRVNVEEGLEEDRDAAVFEVDFEERRRAQEIASLVWGRRAADKTGPLTRWARVQVD